MKKRNETNAHSRMKMQIDDRLNYDEQQIVQFTLNIANRMWRSGGGGAEQEVKESWRRVIELKERVVAGKDVLPPCRHHSHRFSFLFCEMQNRRIRKRLRIAYVSWVHMTETWGCTTLNHDCDIFVALICVCLGFFCVYIFVFV